MGKLSFRGKKMTGMAPPAGSPSGPGMGGMMGGLPAASRPTAPPPRSVMPMPKPKLMPVMKQKGMALAGFAPRTKKAIPKKKMPKMAGNPFKRPF